MQVNSRIEQYIIEAGLSMPCIVVDVQPSYYRASYSKNKHIIRSIVNFISKQTGQVLMYVNAERDGHTNDTIATVKEFWEDFGFNPEHWDRVTIVDKGYGYLRPWMDQKVPPALIIKTIREMYRLGVSDSRELFGGSDNSEQYTLFKEFLGNDFESWMLDDAISVNWLSIKQLKRFQGSYIMGGGRNECLREVELMMNVFNIQYKRIDSLVYS